MWEVEWAGLRFHSTSGRDAGDFSQTLTYLGGIGQMGVSTACIRLEVQLTANFAGILLEDRISSEGRLDSISVPWWDRESCAG